MSIASQPPRPFVRLSFVRFTALAAAGIALLGAGAYVGATRLGAYLRLAGATTSTAPLTVAVGDVGLTIPANAIRFSEQRRDGATLDELDLYLAWPSLQGFDEANTAPFDDPQSRNLLFVKLMASGTSAAPESRAAVALRPAGSDRPGLLTAERPGVDGISSLETLYEAPASRVPPYSVACLDREPQPAMAADCIREIMIEPGTALRYRFSHERLGEWDAIDKAVLRYIDEHRRP